MVRARKEVILCAGAVCTPWLLQLSGVGPAEHLKEHHIPVVADLPGVGQNLQDHLMVPIAVPMKPGHTNGFADNSPLDVARMVLDYALCGKGAGSVSPVSAMAFCRSGLTPEHHGNDLQILLIPFLFHGKDQFQDNLGFVPRSDRPGELSDPANMPQEGFSILPSLILPRSTGSISLSSSDPSDYPIIEPCYLQNSADMAILVEGYKFAKRALATPPLSDICDEAVVDPSIPHPPDSDDYVQEHIRRAIVTLYHPTGTAKMGSANDPNAVVDTSLRVHGLSGLRVADASIMPKVISGNTNAASVMIGERVAHMLKQSWGMPL